MDCTRKYVNGLHLMPLGHEVRTTWQDNRDNLGGPWYAGSQRKYRGKKNSEDNWMANKPIRCHSWLCFQGKMPGKSAALRRKSWLHSVWETPHLGNVNYERLEALQRWFYTPWAWEASKMFPKQQFKWILQLEYIRTLKMRHYVKNLLDSEAVYTTNAI